MSVFATSPDMHFLGAGEGGGLALPALARALAAAPDADGPAALAFGADAARLLSVVTQSSLPELDHPILAAAARGLTEAVSESAATGAATGMATGSATEAATGSGPVQATALRLASVTSEWGLREALLEFYGGAAEHAVLVIQVRRPTAPTTAASTT